MNTIMRITVTINIFKRMDPDTKEVSSWDEAQKVVSRMYNELGGKFKSAEAVCHENGQTRRWNVNGQIVEF